MQSFLNMCQWEPSEGIKRCNSSLRLKNYYESCANKHNDQLFRIMLNMYPNSHEDFIESYELFETQIIKLPVATPDKIKDEFLKYAVR